ncbi:hypothetical protein BJ166DRAFT_536493 [Pestalotiopsis sp. NC0098]|nr:hypothetical protein BJ166DRAFT_536493 [Pestalotiopsis sp. NC0098]
MISTRVAPLHLTTPRTCLRQIINSHVVSKRCYRFSRKTANEEELEATTPVAVQLKNTRVWEPRLYKPASPDKPARKINAPAIAGDKQRVNIVSEKLCDDILSYIGKSLEKHKGCDLVDLNPGVGLWSSKLHEFLQPRSHVLMEPDADLYQDFLRPLLKKEGTSLVPKNGILWKDLNSVLSPDYLPHQKPLRRDDDGSNAPNDTLLISFNLAFHPKKKFQSFESLATLILHQFLDSIKTSSLFHKYGQVRMLVWTRRDDKTKILPRLMQKRRRTAVDAEILCHNINEVVGWNGREQSFDRDRLIDRASAVATLKRMRAAGMKIPAGRETDIVKLAKVDSRTPKQLPAPGTVPPVIDREYQTTLEELKTLNPKKGTKDHRALLEGTWRENSYNRQVEGAHDILRKGSELSAAKLRRELSHEAIKSSEQELQHVIERLPTVNRSGFASIRDNLHLWQQAEPALLYDRRSHEPLLGAREEFYPNVETCLLDIIPKPVHRLIRDIGHGSSRAGESIELIQKALWAEPTAPINKALDTVWPGAADWIVPRCPSLRESTRGGVILDVKGLELNIRTLNKEQWVEIFEQWFQWPFRPEFVDLVSRSIDVVDEDDPIR